MKYSPDEALWAMALLGERGAAATTRLFNLYVDQRLTRRDLPLS